jgi:hypothetical protein
MSKKNRILKYSAAKTTELTFLRVFCAKFVNVLTVCVKWTAVIFVVIARAVKIRVSNLGSCLSAFI